MKPLLTCLLSFLALNAFSQSKAQPVNIVLTGNVYSFESSEKPYIYFALVGKKFTLRDRIKMDEKTGYVFDLSKTSYKNSASGVLVFSLDTTYKMNDPYSCVHRIDLGEINKYAKAKGLKSLKLKSDLVMDFHCETSIVSNQAEGGVADFVGKYKQALKDTVRVMELEKGSFIYRDSCNYLDSDLMNGGYGRWDLKENPLSIKVNIWYRINKQFGTMLRKSAEKTYKVGNENGIALAYPGEISFKFLYQ
jgi:hypothetical protein